MKIKYKSGTARAAEFIIKKEKSNPGRYSYNKWSYDTFSKLRTRKGFIIKVNGEIIKNIVKKYYILIDTGLYFKLKAKK